MYLIDADGVVVNTAAELLRTHQPTSAEDPNCGTCGEPVPCRVAANAMQIRSAANIATASA